MSASSAMSTRWPNVPPARSCSVWLEDLVDHLHEPRVEGVVLPGRAGDVPAMDEGIERAVAGEHRAGHITVGEVAQSLQRTWLGERCAAANPAS